MHEIFTIEKVRRNEGGEQRGCINAGANYIGSRHKFVCSKMKEAHGIVIGSTAIMTEFRF